MAEAQPTSHMAIFVLMAILLTAVTTTATPHQSPDHAVEGRGVPDNATEDRVSRRQSAAESHHGGHDGHVAEEDSEKKKEGRALADIQKRSSCGLFHEYVGIEIKTTNALWAGTDGEVTVRITGENGRRSIFYKIDDPNVNDFERGSQKKYYFCAEHVGLKIKQIGVKLKALGRDPDWNVAFMKFLYRDQCYFFNFEQWLDCFTCEYEKLPGSGGCQW